MEDREESPTARALRTLELLQAVPGITSAELGDRLRVTDRAARRYISMLREAGVPVESVRGPYGGYRVGRGLRLPPLVFSSSEALGLVMAVLDGQHAAADPNDPVGSALGKLLHALPERVGRQAAALRANALAAPSREATSPDPAILTTLVDAVAAQRQARLAYRTASGSELDTVVDPWAVIVRFGRWYLLCLAHHADSVRTFRIDRIHAFEPLATRFQPPADLDPVALLEQHLGTSREYATRVTFDAPYADVVPFINAPMGRLESLDGGARCRLTGSTSNPAMYAGEWLSALPFPFHVEGGPELHDAVAEVGRRMTAAVGQPSSMDLGRPASSGADG
jgi:predicted DNA-binding transcriptional regulator YafY